MQRPSEINYLGNAEIDRVQWDACIEQATNGLIYGYSFYLDEMSPGWDALVLGNYEAVMPLTRKRKYGIHYLAQPFLTAQLGIFGKSVDAATMAAFLKAIPAKFRYCDIYLNHGNAFDVKGYDIYQRSNYILRLSHSYEDLRAGYRENIIRNIKRSADAGCEPAYDIDTQKVVDLALFHMREQNADTRENVRRFLHLFHKLRHKGMAKVFGICSAQHKLLSSAVFFYSHGRAYYILVGNHPDGRTLGASHALIDHFIREHAGQKLLLDFEGSDIRNLAFFYSSFGAREEKYVGLKWNRLPWWMKLFKK